jgi:large subunit ribosomal protein L9
MKVVYLKNDGGHKKGDVKEVAEGYFRNLLSPKGIAVAATSENVAKVKKELDQKIKETTTGTNEAQKIANSISGRKVEIKVKANESGKLYAAVSGDDVLNALAKQGVKVKGNKVVFGSHIKEPGSYKIKIDFGHGILSEITLIVRV